MTHPFEDDAAEYMVLGNERGQFSLWPNGFDVPAGWHVALPATGRQECLRFVEERWTDIQPRPLPSDDGEGRRG